MSKQNICIRLKSYDHSLVDKSVAHIIEAVQRTGCHVRGPVPLPTKTHRFTLLRSPHVNKKSREQLEQRTHLRRIDIHEPSDRTIDAFSKLELPAGVDIEIKLQSNDKQQSADKATDKRKKS